jgi:carbonic anhydrase/acetyltransferase-like protein (isoleucine patch superfamily)
MSSRPYLTHHPVYGKEVFVDPTALVIGQVLLGDHVSVWPMAVLRGDLLPIHVGAYSNIQDGSILHTTHKSSFSPDGHALSIGSYVTIGHKALLHGCRILDESLIGMGAIVLDGAVIASHVMVAAGSLVPPGKQLESGWLYRGSPVKAVRPLTPEEIAFFRYSPEHYAQLKDQYRSSNTE